MGLTPLSKSQAQIPKSISLKQLKDILIETSEIIHQNKRQLKLLVNFDMNSLKTHLKDWKKYTILAYISNYAFPGQKIPAGGECKFDMEQIYNIHKLIQYLRKQKLAQSESRETVKGDQDDQKECCICLDQKPTTMLPCSHSYCALCTSKYIIEQEEHRCPQCRRQFHGNSKTIKKEFFEVIEEDKMVYQQARRQIVECVGKYNVKTMQILQEEASQFIQK